jgi:hypothetical protein
MSTVRTFSARSRRAALPVATVIHSQGPTSGTLGSGRTQKSAVAECRKELASAFPESDRALRRREAAGGRSGRRTPPMRYTGRPVPASRARKAIAGPAGADVSVRGKALARSPALGAIAPSPEESSSPQCPHRESNRQRDARFPRVEGKAALGQRDTRAGYRAGLSRRSPPVNANSTRCCITPDAVTPEPPATATGPR